MDSSKFLLRRQGYRLLAWLGSLILIGAVVVGSYLYAGYALNKTIDNSKGFDISIK